MKDYKSEAARKEAVFKYFLVAYIATLITFSAFLAVSIAAGIANVPLILVLIAAQNISWITTGTMMCAVFDSLGTPPPPPREKWKTVTQSNKVTGKTDVTEIVREKTWKV